MTNIENQNMSNVDNTSGELIELKKKLAEEVVDKLIKKDPNIATSLPKWSMKNYLVDENNLKDIFHDKFLLWGLWTLMWFKISPTLKKYREMFSKVNTKNELENLRTTIFNEIWWSEIASTTTDKSWDTTTKEPSESNEQTWNAKEIEQEKENKSKKGNGKEETKKQSSNSSKKTSEKNISEWNESRKLDDTKVSSSMESGWNDKDNGWNLEWKREKLKNKKEKSRDSLNSEKLKAFFGKNANDLCVDKIDNKDFFEVSYIDKNSGSKVKGIIPFKWNWDSNIYMPWDRSWIEETMKQKNFKQRITDKNSKKARFIFEWDSNKIKNWTQQSARYNNLIKNFENMISPIKAAGDNPKVNIIWHSRAGATVNKLIGKYWSISNYIILDWTYWVYKNVMQSKIPGKIFYTNGGGTAKYISNYKNKPNVEVSGEYAKLDHEAIVSKVLFDTPSTNQELFA